MNATVFSMTGYLGVALALGVPLLWLVYWRLPRPWLRHLAAGLTLPAFLCVQINASTHIRRIEILPSEQLTERASREEAIRQAALEGRETEVAQITFAEDAAGDFLDKAGMDDADLKYLGGSDASATPEWRREKQSRSQGASGDATPEDKLAAEIGGPEAEADGAAVLPDAPEGPKPLLMSEADAARARRLDRWSRAITLYLMLGSLLLLALDYVRRANQYDRASRPMPIPGALGDALTPMPPQVLRPQPPRRSIPEELEWIVRRGDSFVYLTDDPAAADAALAHLETHPKRRPPPVLRVGDGQDPVTNEFVFEGLWYRRSSFVIDVDADADAVLAQFNERLTQRRATRARTRQTAHVVWDVRAPISEATRATFVELARATGFSLFICHDSRPT